MSDVTDTLENQQAFQGDGKVRRVKGRDGEVVREGTAEGVVEGVSDGSVPGVKEDAEEFLSRKGITREYLEGVVSDVVLGVLKSSK